ncbi:hypothetical protein SAMN02746089_02353 [Caldanaerobius fijiensis DSM 17918]|uniref:Uncharacterized protein n=1 Tax=Caldanaerobius fijiensis DSM 17918 TaxID=1121256 RepID=A0A1M5DJ48_9THEO|nr:hypothetical protein [Caldanaerobius fijiensis]SHF66946.1 hypothetical protein SAMN02746089_02353 [Caldanaerobius fijiensis DSM 17918]
MSVSINKVAFAGWENCIQISNGIVDIVATVDVGPRLIRYGFTGDVNEFAVKEEDAGKVGGNQWRNYGGHRLWHSPEVMPRTYSPDNEVVDWQEIQNGVRLIQKPEPWVNMQKEITVILSPDSSEVKLIHKITNTGAWAVKLAPWSISVMATGGIEIIPQIDKDTGFLPNRSVVLWPYSKMNDHRVFWGERYIALKQDPDMKSPFKLGTQNEKGWVAYINNGHMFVKRYTHITGAEYPDFGASFETYTTDWMIEIETLGPLVELQPGSSVEHVEEWELIDGVKTPDFDEVAFDEIARLIKIK